MIDVVRSIAVVRTLPTNLQIVAVATEIGGTILRGSLCVFYEVSLVG